jgi:hypothetical protein
VQRFTVGNFEIQSSKIKSVKLLKVSRKFNFILCLFCLLSYYLAFTGRESLLMFHTILVKVLARVVQKTSLEYMKNGFLGAMTWNLYQLAKVREGKIKLRSALTIEQLQFWRVCIRYGYCVS